MEVCRLTERNLVRWGLAFWSLATITLLNFTGLSVSAAGLGYGPAVAIPSGLACGQFYHPVGKIWVDRLVVILECLALLSVASLLGSVCSYGFAALSEGWMDDELLAMDRMIGIDWPTYWNFVQAYPILNFVLARAYTSFFLTPTLLVVALSAAGNVQSVYRFVLTYMLMLAVAVISVAVIPGKSAAAIFLASDAINLPGAGTLHIPIIEQLRDGSLRVIRLAAIDGLVAFPSFHAATAVLFAWTGWQVRWLRYPCLGLNILMLMATPIQGGHYFSDVLAGIMLAIGMIAIIGRVTWFTGLLERTTSAHRRSLLQPA